MSYDPELADRLRELLADEPQVAEKKMFGGLVFLVAGHMTVACNRAGLMLRVDPGQGETLLTDPRARPFVMQGRELSGWLQVEIDASATDEDLGGWVEQGVSFVRSLPPK